MLDIHGYSPDGRVPLPPLSKYPQNPLILKTFGDNSYIAEFLYPSVRESAESMDTPNIQTKLLDFT